MILREKQTYKRHKQRRSLQLLSFKTINNFKETPIFKSFLKSLLVLNLVKSLVFGICFDSVRSGRGETPEVLSQRQVFMWKTISCKCKTNFFTKFCQFWFWLTDNPLSAVRLPRPSWAEPLTANMLTTVNSATVDCCMCRVRDTGRPTLAEPTLKTSTWTGTSLIWPPLCTTGAERRATPRTTSPSQTITGLERYRVSLHSDNLLTKLFKKAMHGLLWVCWVCRWRQRHMLWWNGSAPSPLCSLQTSKAETWWCPTPTTCPSTHWSAASSPPPQMTRCPGSCCSSRLETWVRQSVK